MNKTFKVLSVLCAILLSTSVVYADGERFCKTGESTSAITKKVYFGNGMLTDETSAEYSLAAIETELQSRLSPEDFASIGFETAYDPTAGLVLDLLEVVAQRLVDENLYTKFWRFIARAELLPDEIQEVARDKVTEATIAALQRTDFLAEHEMQYLEDMLSGKKVYVVAHSKGNIDVNNVYNALKDTPGSPVGGAFNTFPLNVQAVATPAGYLISGGYTTLFGDKIIEKVSLASKLTGVVPPPLPPDMFNRFAVTDPDMHSFLKAYMDTNADSKEKIMFNLNQQFGFTFPPPLLSTISDGVITVMAVWGTSADSDIDIHIEEPNGTVVSASNPQGDVGFLDLADNNGFGPEHYAISCNALKAGVYHVSASHPGGIALLETAFVKVRGGADQKTFQRNFTTGNRNLTPVADIIVGGNRTDGFLIAVQEVVGN